MKWVNPQMDNQEFIAVKYTHSLHVINATIIALTTFNVYQTIKYLNPLKYVVHCISK